MQKPKLSPAEAKELLKTAHRHEERVSSVPRPLAKAITWKAGDTPIAEGVFHVSGEDNCRVDIYEGPSHDHTIFTGDVAKLLAA